MYISNIDEFEGEKLERANANSLSHSLSLSLSPLSLSLSFSLFLSNGTENRTTIDSLPEGEAEGKALIKRNSTVERASARNYAVTIATPSSPGNSKSKVSLLLMRLLYLR